MTTRRGVLEIMIPTMIVHGNSQTNRNRKVEHTHTTHTDYTHIIYNILEALLNIIFVWLLGVYMHMIHICIDMQKHIICTLFQKKHRPETRRLMTREREGASYPGVTKTTT